MTIERLSDDRFESINMSKTSCVMRRLTCRRSGSGWLCNVQISFDERRLIEEKIWGLRARLSAIRGLTQHGIRNEAEAFFWFHEIERETASVPPYVRRAWEEVTVGRFEKQRANGVEAGRFADQLNDDLTGARSANRADEGDPTLNEDSCNRSEPGKREIGAKHKSLYRKIARLLHPDLAGVLTQHELELWYQAQRAYEEKDVVALETILARCDRVGTNSRTLSELRELVIASQFEASDFAALNRWPGEVAELAISLVEFSGGQSALAKCSPRTRRRPFAS